MSGFTDTTMGVRSIGTRTDSGGTGVTDISAEEDRFANIFVAEGYISPVNAFAPAGDTAWNIDIGSGTTKSDYYVVEGFGVSQGNYVVRLDQAGDVVTISPADLSNPRLDEIYLVVMDNAYDASGLSIPRLAVRQGDTGAVPELPGPDPAWLSYAILGTVNVPAGAADITECTVTDVRIQSQSNVDAPTLEGNAAAAFSTAGHLHTPDYTPISHEGNPTGHPDAGGSDGMLSAFNKSKLNIIETGAEDNLSAAEVLALLVTVDGGGSGLDADLLDGSSSAAFATSGHDHDSDYYTESEVDAFLTPKAGGAQHLSTHRGNSNHILLSGYESSPIFYIDPWDDWSGHPANTGYFNDGPAGYYLVQAQAVFAANTSGNIRRIRLYHNEDGNVAFGLQGPIQDSGELTIVQCETVVYMDGTDRITMFLLQDSGSNLGYTGFTTWLRATFLG